MPNTDQDAALRELLERDAIRELARRYCHRVWQRDIRVIELFAADGRFGKAQGRDELLKFYTAAIDPAGSNPHPYVNNHVVDFQGPDRATGTAYSDIRLDDNGFRALNVGYWRDEYVRVAGEWKFKSRDYTMSYRVRLAPIDPR